MAHLRNKCNLTFEAYVYKTFILTLQYSSDWFPLRLDNVYVFTSLFSSVAKKNVCFPRSS
jgi:hypothetical protein